METSHNHEELLFFNGLSGRCSVFGKISKGTRVHGDIKSPKKAVLDLFVFQQPIIPSGTAPGGISNCWANNSRSVGGLD